MIEDAHGLTFTLAVIFAHKFPKTPKLCSNKCPYHVRRVKNPIENIP